MELNPPPPYPGPEAAYPPVQVVQDVYPAPPKYSATVVQTVNQTQPVMVVNPVEFQYPAPPKYSAAVVQPVNQTQPVMVVNPVVVQPALSDVPASMTCTYCQKQIVTVIKPSNGLLVWCAFGVMLVFGLWPCCLIPFCVHSCKDIQHMCPNCRNILHTYRRM
ncbi:hypothetical protein QTP70_034679 [Hemibagrus guttatus]|uniref:LITAF domain-containing protein n=1 Tax=Hemibagrus guttatus TaxID=175788 RepID=A0AAE0Q025_9TELE|nr:hypothetical protein QTP70_034679 [Hemibagrus guttatus]